MGFFSPKSKNSLYTVVERSLALIFIFLEKQCFFYKNINACWCVNAAGEELPNSRQTFGAEMNEENGRNSISCSTETDQFKIDGPCSNARAEVMQNQQKMVVSRGFFGKFMWQKAPKPTYVPECNDRGFFSPLQCDSQARFGKLKDFI